jgi:cytochrome c oxidase subunit 2
MGNTSSRWLARLLALAIVCTAFFLTAARSPAQTERLIHMTAKKFAFEPSEITVRKGEPVVIEIVSLDKNHGFSIPELGVRTDVRPDTTARVRVVPERSGQFEFECDVKCGSGHDDMRGVLNVVDE